MALPATLRRFAIALSDTDREVYEQLDWRVPQHPSESPRYLVARVIARCLEHAEGVEFSKGGVSDDEEPAIVQRNLRGEWVAWIEVGAPTPARLHKAAKLAPRVAVYGWKQVDALRDAIALEKVHKGDDIAIRELPADLLDAVAATLDRTNTWELSVTGGTLYLGANGRAFEGAVRPVG